MTNLFKNSKALLTLVSVSSVITTASVAQALTLKVEVENLGLDGGVALTPVWVGFHDGSFDSYNGGLPSEKGLERIAEDGNTMPISIDFLANKTYVQGGMSGVFDSTQVGTRVDGAIGGGPITAETMAMSTFDVTPDESNRWFSYVSMVLPSNDYYVANGNPFAWDLMDLFTGNQSQISFNIGLPGTVNDAGTEVNNFSTSAGNGLFPELPAGQGGQNQGADENGVNANVADPYANFLNRPTNFDTAFADLDFNDTTLYPNGIASITISVESQSVPESSTTVGLMAMVGLFVFGGLRRRNHHFN
ncbi:MULTISPECIES: spondin domain-containing protein [Okeania]|uniref:PEP-CTERM sorting domain-containing protein n=1 Tax=Okeania hirsuta TaxID=1458930 RepID=A0A3N6Q3I6_9CYAN|nr:MULTISPECIES: spondin domain-containing protein [Okeania]NET11650.1 PEP-CTERM sorting domain-containing protein [Okeania sp. SIO1H6]NES75910.1 PEP-CTERM sorting domain-containing protein [Okeania sp. SIO1H4]NES91445.1 PEP-CTERM sorting domain-containing protein [Okeania sp. SIO2B9]NET22223.1 PEP-CTERM sorting domain-containing protein [Okeania sp. SIO1H5]NET75827.1 PEP-CTERM sorting domain-containing protein [Okeania sp. SIO1F9]